MVSTKKRSGSGVTRRGILLGLATAAAVAALASGQRLREPSVLIAGTVFDGAGFRVSGARVRLEQCSRSKGSRGGRQRYEVRTDSMGEFAVRVPRGPACYRVLVEAKGHVPAEVQVDVAGEEDHELTIRLSRETGSEEE